MNCMRTIPHLKSFLCPPYLCLAISQTLSFSPPPALSRRRRRHNPPLHYRYAANTAPWPTAGGEQRHQAVVPVVLTDGTPQVCRVRNRGVALRWRRNGPTRTEVTRPPTTPGWRTKLLRRGVVHPLRRGGDASRCAVDRAATGEGRREPRDEVEEAGHGRAGKKRDVGVRRTLCHAGKKMEPACL
jgi:hypothetical protein